MLNRAFRGEPEIFWTLEDSILLLKQEKEKPWCSLFLIPWWYMQLQRVSFLNSGKTNKNLTASLTSVLWKWSWKVRKNIFDLFQKLRIYMNRKYIPWWSVISNYQKPGNWTYYFMLFNMGFRNLESITLFMEKHENFSFPAPLEIWVSFFQCISVVFFLFHSFIHSFIQPLGHSVILSFCNIKLN